MAQVQINRTVLTKQVNEEQLKLKELQEFYGLNATQMSKALRACNLTISKKRAPAFVITEEEVSLEELEAASPQNTPEDAAMETLAQALQEAEVPRPSTFEQIS